MSTVLFLALQHLSLVVVSTALAIVVGVPLGVLAAHRPRLGRVVVAVAGAVQVVPSLALFGILLPLPLIGGIGARSAVVALLLYALLPIVSGTNAGIAGIDPTIVQAAAAMGMTPRQVLRLVELPLASRVILAGVRTAVVIGVGVATIAAAIGAGGLGTLIFRGLRMNDDRLVLSGAVPAALMALALDGALALVRALGERSRSAGRVAAAALGSLLVIAAVVPLLWHPGAPGPLSAEPGSSPRPRVTVCTKDFTEQVLLGELLAQGLEARGVAVTRRFELGGNLCNDALLAGSVDVYPEYSGTAYTALLHHAPLNDPEAVFHEIRSEYWQRYGIVVSDPLGFANDFVLLMRAGDRDHRGLRTLSDLAKVTPPLRAGFGQDFMSRPDGYAGLVATYGLAFAGPPREMDLSLTYRALADGQVDVIAGDSTHGLVQALSLASLEDDRHYFPPYQAVWLLRSEARTRVPELAAEIQATAGILTTERMRQLNYACDGRKVAPAEVVRAFRASPPR